MPLWVGNLQATDAAVVTIRGQSIPVTWEEMEGAERATAWQVMLRTWPNFASTRRAPIAGSGSSA